MKIRGVALILLIGLVGLGIAATCLSLASSSAVSVDSPENFGTFLPAGNGTATNPLGDPIDTPGMPT